MTDDQVQLAITALQRIAADHELTRHGRRKRLARHQAVNIAREACERLGIDYSLSSVKCRG